MGHQQALGGVSAEIPVEVARTTRRIQHYIQVPVALEDVGNVILIHTLDIRLDIVVEIRLQRVARTIQRMVNNKLNHCLEVSIVAHRDRERFTIARNLKRIQDVTAGGITERKCELSIVVHRHRRLLEDLDTGLSVGLQIRVERAHKRVSARAGIRNCGDRSRHVYTSDICFSL